ncbi:MAG: hypothetical protein U5K76_05335 [Woeseiaceae bacterium]|nr:hypothetical protein [Woeseiaceae bacterium]
MSENAKTIPGIASRHGGGRGGPTAQGDDADDVFSQTTVIGKDDPAVNDPDERLQPGSVLRDRFLLQERVAGGSMGVVYKALDRRLAEVDGVEPYVAIKVLSRNCRAAHRRCGRCSRRPPKVAA